MEEYYISQKENLSDFLIKLKNSNINIYKVSKHGDNWQIITGDIAVENKEIRGDSMVDEVILKEYTEKIVALINDLSEKKADTVKDSLKKEIASMLADIESMKKLVSDSKATVATLVTSTATTAKNAVDNEINRNKSIIDELKKSLEANKIAIKSAADEIATLKSLLGDDGAKLQKVIAIFKDFGSLVSKNI